MAEVKGFRLSTFGRFRVAIAALTWDRKASGLFSVSLCSSEMRRTYDWKQLDSRLSHNVRLR